MSTHLEIADALARASAVIHERGWTQGNYESEDGRVCLMGAVSKARGVPYHYSLKDPVVWECDLALKDAISHTDAGEWENPEDWNDWASRTVEEVIDLLEGVAWQYQIKAEAESQREPVLVG